MQPISIHRYAPLELVDVPKLVASCKDRWFNQTLCKVNEWVVRLGVMEGEYHWRGARGQPRTAALGARGVPIELSQAIRP